MKPPFTITSAALGAISRIERSIGRIEGLNQPKPQPYLRKSNRIRKVQGSLAIEGNTLSLDQVTALIEGKTVIGDKKNIREVVNAIEVYDRMERYDPFLQKDLLKAHKAMMAGLIKSAGQWRRGNVGIMKGDAVSHVAPQANRVGQLMDDLFKFSRDDTHHLLIRGCVFHYELEFIHPFEDGNGRIGRFWHSLLLHAYHEVFRYIPVESLIRDHQQDYYAVLEISDRQGDSTPFVEFALSMIDRALAEFLDDLKPVPLTSEARLNITHAHFGDRTFSRKDYLKCVKTISTATASRDLKEGVAGKRLIKQGSRAQTVYRFKRN